MPKSTQIKVNIKGDIITLFQRKGIWYADFRRVGGGRPTLETGNKTYAIRIAEKMYEKFAEVKYGIKGDLNIGQVLDKFMKYSRDRKSSWRSDVGRTNNILEYFPSSTFLKTIKKSQVEEFENHLKKKGYAQNTRNRHLELLKAAIQRVIDNGDFKGDNVVKKITIHKVETTAQRFTPEEIKSILGYAAQVSGNPKTSSQFYFHPFIYLAFNSGMRAGEIFQLKWNDVNPVRIRLYDTKRHKLKKQEKGFDDIPMVPWLWNYIQELPKDSFYILNTPQRRTNTFRTIWLKMRGELNLNKHATIHWIRHSVASYLLDQLVPPHIVQAILRHANIATTQTYSHTDLERMREEMMKLKNIQG